MLHVTLAAARAFSFLLFLVSFASGLFLGFWIGSSETQRTRVDCGGGTIYTNSLPLRHWDIKHATWETERIDFNLNVIGVPKSLCRVVPENAPLIFRNK